MLVQVQQQGITAGCNNIYCFGFLDYKTQQVIGATRFNNHRHDRATAIGNLQQHAERFLYRSGPGDAGCSQVSGGHIPGQFAWYKVQNLVGNACIQQCLHQDSRYGVMLLCCAGNNSVSAGKGETQTADYLANLLRVYGAYAVGTLTAMGVSPGEFVGKEIVQQRAADLANDLTVAVRKKRRHPATDIDLAFYQFMGNLVRRNKDSVMRDDYEHWQKGDLFDNFEGYIGQKTAKARFNPEVRKTWLKEMIAGHKAKKKDDHRQPTNTSREAPRQFATCEELLRSMPLGFNAAAADGLEAVYQFEVNSQENFSGYLEIKGNQCTFHAGDADNPSVVIKTPADVWLSISAGEMDGQQAFLSGKYTVEGDLSLLMKMHALFPE